MSWKLKRRQIDEPDVLPYFAIGLVASLDEVLAFDRNICARGCTRFMRDLTDFDLPVAHVQDQRQQGNRYVVVHELRHGVRRRTTGNGSVILRNPIPAQH